MKKLKKTMKPLSVDLHSHVQGRTSNLFNYIVSIVASSSKKKFQTRNS